MAELHHYLNNIIDEILSYKLRSLCIVTFQELANNGGLWGNRVFYVFSLFAFFRIL